MPPLADCAQFIVSELARYGVVVPDADTLPTIGGLWDVTEQDVPPSHAGFALAVRDSSLDEMDRFFRALLQRLRTPDSQHFEEDGSFTFRSRSGDYFFTPGADRFVVSFPSLVIAVGSSKDVVTIQVIRR